MTSNSHFHILKFFKSHFLWKHGLGCALFYVYACMSLQTFQVIGQFQEHLIKSKVFTGFVETDF